ncbi:MAG: hypothetical protein PHV30_10605 [Candidatus Margulisbacteria bacterium]|nr:hypothetical protein [Candidatus Margulisiibacteriota bacterium]
MLYKIISTQGSYKYLYNELHRYASLSSEEIVANFDNEQYDKLLQNLVDFLNVSNKVSSIKDSDIGFASSFIMRFFNNHGIIKNLWPYEWYKKITHEITTKVIVPNNFDQELITLIIYHALSGMERLPYYNYLKDLLISLKSQMYANNLPPQTMNEIKRSIERIFDRNERFFFGCSGQGSCEYFGKMVRALDKK